MAAWSAAGAAEVAFAGLGVASDVTSIVGGALEEASPKASSILGWASLGTGLAGAGAGIGLAAARGSARLAEQAPRTTELFTSETLTFTGPADALRPDFMERPGARAVRRSHTYGLPEYRPVRRRSGEYGLPAGPEWAQQLRDTPVGAPHPTKPGVRTTATLRLNDGRTFTGQSGWRGSIRRRPSLEDIAGGLAADSQFSWKCAEIDCLIQARQAGVEYRQIVGARSVARGWDRRAGTTRWMEPCHGDKHLLAALGIDW